MPRDVYSPEHVRRLAKENRKNKTLSERLLWSRLRRRAIDGVWFKEQEPMGRYVADFCAPKERLIIEIDGSAHDHSKEYDVLRDEWFHSLGYRTLRVTANDVEQRIHKVLGQIREALQSK